jgi:hypothetical protein
MFAPLSSAPLQLFILRVFRFVAFAVQCKCLTSLAAGDFLCRSLYAGELSVRFYSSLATRAHTQELVALCRSLYVGRFMPVPRRFTQQLAHTFGNTGPHAGTGNWLMPSG